MLTIDGLITLYTRTDERLRELIQQLEEGSWSRRRKEELLRQVSEIIEELTGKAGQQMALLIGDGYRAGALATVESLTAAGIALDTIEQTLKPLIHTQAAQAIMDEAFYSILEASEHMTNDAKRRIEDAVRAANEQSLVEGVNRRQATKQAVADLNARGITGMIAKNGARIPADKYMSSVVHYHQRKAHVTGSENMSVQNGYDLVYVNYVGITCEMCATKQGRVYSISGKDKRFPPFEGNKPPYHSHCVHSATPWLEEYATPEEKEKMIADSNRPFVDNRTERNINRYKEIQQLKSQKNETRKQWIRYKSAMPNETPDLKTFASHKARNTQAYQDLQAGNRKVNEEIKLTTPHYDLITAKNTEIPDSKLTNYALDPTHPKGKDKARVFQSALGYNQSNYKDLIDNIHRNLPRSAAYFKGSTAYGDKYEVVMPLIGPNGNIADVLTAWMMKDKKARLTSIYVKT